MFVEADADLEFSKVAEVIDMGHQANVDNIGADLASAYRGWGSSKTQRQNLLASYPSDRALWARSAANPSRE